ncbi:MAG: Hsp20/alpha crystallin family protein [Candidatus Dojkabacteria bacterium]|nr:Hsp20/alpha crystallin family protein [Candidatus Dojkabacteria bacterium]
MRRLTVWNPWNISPRWSDWDEDSLMGDMTAGMDVFEQGDNVIVKLNAPGFKKDQLDISVEAGKITIVGKAQEQTEEEDKSRKYYRKEISTRSFTRSCDLPFDVVPGKAEAKYEDGVLTVTLPKSENAKPTKIKLNVD